MKKMLGVLCAIAMVFMFAANANADPWLDEVVDGSFIDVDPPDNQGDPPEIVLGPTGVDGNLTLSTGDEVIVAFIDNYAFDGDGDDIRLYEHEDVSDEELFVYASSDNVDYVELVKARNDAWYDLADYPGLDTVKYFRLVGDGLGGTNPGYDLSAIEALNSIDETCWGLGCPQATQVSTLYGHETAHKSNILNVMSILLVSMGAVIFLKILRRKR